MRRLALLIAGAGGLLLMQAAPLVTFHAIVSHSGPEPHPGPMASLVEPGLIFQVVLAGAAAMPLAGLLVAVLESVRANRRLKAATSPRERRSYAAIEYWRVPGDGVTLFVAGLRRPRIYASSSAETTLPPAAFHAALLHEQAHLRRADALLRQLLHATERAFGRLPGVRPAVRRLRLRSECLADRAALAAGADRLALFDAIVAATSTRRPAEPALSDGSVLPRLEALAGEERPLPGVGWRGPAAVGGVLVLPPLAAHLLLWLGLVCAPAL